MSRLSDAQYALVDAYIDSALEGASGIAPGDAVDVREDLARAVYGDGALWDLDAWEELARFVSDKLDGALG